MSKQIAIILMLCLSFSSIQADQDQISGNKEIENLYSSMSQSLDFTSNHLVHKHVFASFSSEKNLVTLEDGMSFTVNWWYKSIPQNWKKGDQVHITYDFEFKQLKIEHATLKDVVWATLETFSFPVPKIDELLTTRGNQDAYSKLTLDNGYVFRSVDDKAFGINGWEITNRVVILANTDELYQLWDLETKKILEARFVENRNIKKNEAIEIKDILNMEDRLNAKVLQQPEAVASVVTSLLNYVVGLKEKEQPVGVFLFLGSTGVGKTELAKALTEDIYGDSAKMLRFDMSHFTEPHSIARLIGSPPGYVNHEEGGQLTSPLSENPQRVVLFDEMEKAHPQVLKAFLPVFDEGFILDTKNNRISCSETLFIMTSNLCAEDIAELSDLGYSSEEILESIEPDLIDSLSPELYNRVEPVLFAPIAKETMKALVELMLEKVKERLLVEKKISIHIDDSLKGFLAEKGYYPLLGARPLKKLIEKRVLTALAYFIIKNRISTEATLTLSYDEDSDSVVVHEK